MGAPAADSRETAEETTVSQAAASSALAADLANARIAAGVDAAPLANKTRAAFDSVSFSAVGLEMGVAVILGLLVGRWLDGKAGTTPWLMIVFICFGFAAGLRAVMVAMRKADRAAERNEAIAAARAASLRGTP